MHLSKIPVIPTNMLSVKSLQVSFASQIHLPHKIRSCGNLWVDFSKKVDHALVDLICSSLPWVSNQFGESWRWSPCRPIQATDVHPQVALKRDPAETKTQQNQFGLDFSKMPALIVSLFLFVSIFASTPEQVTLTPSVFLVHWRYSGRTHLQVHVWERDVRDRSWPGAAPRRHQPHMRAAARRRRSHSVTAARRPRDGAVHWAARRSHRWGRGRGILGGHQSTCAYRFISAQATSTFTSHRWKITNTFLLLVASFGFQNLKAVSGVAGLWNRMIQSYMSRLFDVCSGQCPMMKLSNISSSGWSLTTAMETLQMTNCAQYKKLICERNLSTKGVSINFKPVLNQTNLRESQKQNCIQKLFS